MAETLRAGARQSTSSELCALPVQRLLEERLQKYLRMGVYAESA